jgi:hypothetical protein
MTEAAFERMRAQAAAQLEAHAKVENAFDRLDFAGAQAITFAPGLMIDPFVEAFKGAGEANAREAENSAKRILAANEQLRMALVGPAGSVEEALKKLKNLASGKDGDVKMPPINFGPTSISIRQDFRSIDPDRVALIFRRDLAKQATSRIGSKLQTPFGI